MDFHCKSFGSYPTHPHFQCWRLKWIYPTVLTFGLLALTGCKQKSPPEEQSSGSAVTDSYPTRKNPDLPARPANDVITPAQQAFWDYIEIFNRLPDNPTQVQREILETRGEAPSFKFISTSPKSVFSNVEGMKAHRKLFAERYPWVKDLLEKEQITLEVDEAIFQGTTKEIIDKHFDKVAWAHGDYFQPKGNRTVFTKRWLESLLVIDYIYACGSEQDRIDGLLFLTQTFTAAANPGDKATGRVERGHELEIPATFDIAIAIANQYPDQVPEQLINFIPDLTSSSGYPAAYIDCLKWSLRVDEFRKWENQMTFHEIQVGNHCVRNDLFHYTIYWYHMHDKVRPTPGSTAVAIKALFKRIYGNQEGMKEYKKYLALLDAAYPPAPQATPQKKSTN